MSAKPARPRLASVPYNTATQEDLVQPSTTIARHAGSRATLRGAAVPGSVAVLVAAVLINRAADVNILGWLLVIDGFVAASWWAFSRVITLSAPYESAVSVLAGGRVVGQTTRPDVMGPPPHPAIQRLINIRAADASFVLDQLSRLTQLDPRSPLAGHLDLRHVGIIGHSIGGAAAVQVIAADPRFKVAVNLDGKLLGSQSAAHLNRPLLWVQSDGPQTTEYTQGRDRLLSRLRDGGALVTILGSTHTGFTDAASYLTALGRSVIGPATGIGSISLADMTSMTGDTISAFVGPALGVNNGPRMPLHPTVRMDRLITPRSPR
jgi:hypothetical protein